MIEVRMYGAMSLEEVQLFRTRMFLVLGQVTGRAILIGDLRDCDAFSQEVSERLIGMLRTDNPKVERSAFLVRDGALSRLVEQIVREASAAASAAGQTSPPRRTFRTTEHATARTWLGEVLDDAERTRLAQFFRSL